MSLPFNCRAPACKDIHAPIFHRRWKCLFYGATSLVDDLEELSDCTNIPVLGITRSGIVLFLTISFQVATMRFNKNAHSTSKGGKNWNCARMWESGFEVKSISSNDIIWKYYQKTFPNSHTMRADPKCLLCDKCRKSAQSDIWGKGMSLHCANITMMI